jgi:putative ABC transport system permease protein
MLYSIGRGYRSLARRPGFLLAAMLTLALCVGANSAMFSLIDAVLLRPLPYPASERLAVLFETNAARKMGPQGVAPVQVEEWNRMSTRFMAIAGAETQNSTDTSGPLPEKLVCADTSRRFFSVLGVLPLLGREFTLEEERFGDPRPRSLASNFGVGDSRPAPMCWARRSG